MTIMNKNVKLLIDVGNSQTKIGIWQNSKLSRVRICNLKKFKKIISTYANLSYSQILFTSVVSRKNEKFVKETLISKFTKSPIQIKSSKSLCGVKNSYTQSTKLGSDRWCAIVGSSLSNRKPVLIVDCGTAVSIDCVCKTGKHLGGFIFAGYEGYAKSFQRAEKLKNINLIIRSNSKKINYPRNTKDALTLGYIVMITASIEKIYMKFTEDCKEKPVVLLTGAYAKQLEANLNIDFTHEENLVLKCLGIIGDKI